MQKDSSCVYIQINSRTWYTVVTRGGEGGARNGVIKSKFQRKKRMESWEIIDSEEKQKKRKVCFFVSSLDAYPTDAVDNTASSGLIEYLLELY